MALILVTEDDHSINSLMALTLRVEDYEVIQAYDGQQALRLLEQHTPDLVLLDVMMPRKNGFEVAAAMRDRPSTARIPIIFVTAEADMNDRVRGLELGNDYITKPFAAPELLVRVRNVLRMQQLQDELAISNEQLRHMALTDALTGLSNRRRFDSELTQEIARAIRFKQPFSLVLFALDGFEELSARLGAEQAEAVLRSFSEVLRRAARRIDIPARHSDHQFAALLPQTDEKGARIFAQRVLDATRADTIPIFKEAGATLSTQADALHLTASAGIAHFTPDPHNDQSSRDRETLLFDEAANHLQQARQRGDCVVAPTP